MLRSGNTIFTKPCTTTADSFASDRLSAAVPSSSQPALLPQSSVPLTQLSSSNGPVPVATQPIATQHGFNTLTRPNGAVSNGFSMTSSSNPTTSITQQDRNPVPTAAPKSFLSRVSTNNGSAASVAASAPTGSTNGSTTNGLIGLAMQITASQPQPIHARSLKPASIQLSNSLNSSAFGTSPASYNLPPPEQHASNLTIAPLHMQPPQNLPATAAQTAASEALLDLWDAPSGSSAPSGHSGSAYMHIPMLGSLPVHGVECSASGGARSLASQV